MKHTISHRRRFVSVALVMAGVATAGLASCALNAAPSPEPPTASSPGNARPPVMWRETESPLLPIEWPPTADTTWVRYTFAYGQDLNLNDAARVSGPLARTEYRAGGTQTQRIEISNTPEPLAIQGVHPLSASELAALQKQAQVESYGLSLTALPDANAAATTEMIAFYRAWFGNNGAFLDQVRANHDAFIAWIGQ